MKLLASDYDRTLKSNIKNLKININAVNKFMADGNKFAIITGRSFCSIKKEIDEYNIEYDYLSCNNGLIVFDKKDNIIEASLIPKHTLRLIYNICEESSDIKKIKLYDLYNHTNKMDNIIEVAIEFDSIKKATQYKEYFLYTLDNVSCYQTSNKLFIGNSQTKSEAIEIIKNKENIKDDDIYTVGDNLNDLDMLQNYNGYKMLVSHPTLWFKKIPVTNQVHKLIKKISK